MTAETAKHRKLYDHLQYGKGTKTVCVSTCLSFFGIAPHLYTYTSSNKNQKSYENVLRKFGYGVRSRATEFKLKKSRSLSIVKRQIAKSDYTSKDFFILHTCKSTAGHLIVVDGTGSVVIDTAEGGRWSVASVKQVLK
jgi:hypothetical protein